MDKDTASPTVTRREFWDALETVRLYLREHFDLFDPDDSLRDIHEHVLGYRYLMGQHDMSTPVPYPGDDA